MKRHKGTPVCRECRRRDALSNSELCRVCWQDWWDAVHTTAGCEEAKRPT